MAAPNSTPRSRLNRLSSHLNTRLRHPFGRHNIGNPYRSNQNNPNSKRASFFLSRQESELRRDQTERAISDLQFFFREHIPAKKDLQNSQAFSLWLSSNGLLPQFRKLWHEKVIFEKTYQTSSTQLLSDSPDEKSHSIFSRFSPRYFKLRSKYIQGTVGSLANIDMLLPLLRQQIKTPRSNNHSTYNQSPSSSFSLDPASLRSTLLSIATATDQMRSNPSVSSPTVEKSQETKSSAEDSKKSEVILPKQASKEADKKTDTDKEIEHKENPESHDLTSPSTTTINASGSMADSSSSKPYTGFEKQSFTLAIPLQPSIGAEHKQPLHTGKHWSRVSRKFSEFPFLRRAAAPNSLRQQVDAVRWIKYANTSLNNLPDAVLAQHDPNFPRYRAAYKRQEAFLQRRELSRWRTPSMSTPHTISQGKEINLQRETLPVTKEATTGGVISINPQVTITSPLISQTNDRILIEAKRTAASLYLQAGEMPNNFSSDVSKALIAHNLSQIKQPLSGLQGQIPQITSAQIHQGEIEIARLQAKIQSLKPVTRLSTIITPPTTFVSGSQSPNNETFTLPSVSTPPARGGLVNISSTTKLNIPATRVQPGFNTTFNINLPGRPIPKNTSEHQTRQPNLSFNLNGIPASSRRSLRRDEVDKDYSDLPERENPSFTGDYPPPYDEPYTLDSTTTTTEDDQGDSKKKKRGILDTQSFISKYRLAVGVSGGAVFIFLLVFVLGLNGVDASPSSGNGNATSGNGNNNVSNSNQQNIVLQKTVNSASIKLGDKLTYTITVNVINTPVQEIDITDPITFNINGVPTNVTSPYQYSSSTKTLLWKLTNPPQPGGSTTLSFTVIPADNNTSVYNIATATVINGSSTGGSLAANGETCGKYNFLGSDGSTNPEKNFGDPGCDFSLDKFTALIKQLDPNHFYDWYNIIAFGETGGSYNPNSWSGYTFYKQYGCQVAQDGAWGEFQMGNHLGGCDDNNGDKYDYGDVDWRQQVSNAINLNEDSGHNNNFCYWRTAKNAGIAVGCN